MNDFDKRFKKMNDDFDRDFDRTKKLAIVAFVFNLVIVLGLISFGIWVVVQLLQHFGVVWDDRI